MSRQFGSWTEAITVLEKKKEDALYLQRSYAREGNNAQAKYWNEYSHHVQDCIVVLRDNLEDDIRLFEERNKAEIDLHEEGKNNPY